MNEHKPVVLFQLASSFSLHTAGITRMSNGFFPVSMREDNEVLKQK